MESRLSPMPKLIPSAYHGISNNATATFEFNNNMGVLYVARGSSNAMYIFDYWTARSAPSSGSVASGVTVNKAENSRSVTIKNTSGGAIALMGLNGTFK